VKKLLHLLAFWFTAALLAACGGGDHAGFPADHCVDECIAPGDVLVIEPAQSVLLAGSERQLSATVLSTDGSRRDVTAVVTWVSDDAGIVAVSPAGVATGVSPGLAAVSARLPSLEARASLLVSGLAVQEVRVTPALRALLPGLTQQYAATAVLTDGTTVDVTRSAAWSVGDGAVASIDERGLAQGIAQGATTITARYARQALDLSDRAALAVRSPAVTITSFSIEPADATALPGTQVSYRAIAITSENQRIDVTADAAWVSSDTAIASVDAAGVATSKAIGSAQIQATLRYRAQSLAAAAGLQVIGPAVTALRVDPQWAEALVGQQQAYRAIAVLADASEVDVTRRVVWVSDAPAIATISLDGIATALAPGQARLTATLGWQGSSFVGDGLLQVSAPPTLASLSVTPPATALLVDGERQYRCTATFSDGSAFDVTERCQWSTDDPAVALIDPFTGRLTGVATGTTGVVARFPYQGGAASARARVAVIAPVAIEALQVTPSVASSAVGGTRQFEAHLVLSDGRKLDVTDQVAWSSSDPRVAVVGAAGIARARGGGVSTIRAATTIQGVEYSDAAEFGVVDRSVGVNALRVIPPLQSVDAGGRTRFAAELILANGARVPVTDDVTWTSLDGSVARSTQTPGEFIGLSAGTTPVRASLAALGLEQTGDALLRVVAADVVVGLEIDPAHPVLAVGGQRPLHAQMLLANGDTVDVSGRGNWSSSAPGVAAVDTAGVLTGVAAGVATITKTINVGGSPRSVSVVARVLDPASQLVALRVSPDPAEAIAGTSTRFIATAVFLDGSRQDVSAQAAWGIADPAIADLASQDGLVLAKATGSTVVSARYQVGATTLGDSASLVVKAPVVTQIQVSPSRRQIAAGTRTSFVATAVMSDQTHIDVTEQAQWTSSATAVAQVTRRPGEFQALQQGAAAITATLNVDEQQFAGQASLIVTAAVPSYLVVSPPVARLTVGEQRALQATIHFTDGSSYDVTNDVAWQSQNSAVATVSAGARPGLATGAGTGVAGITARYDDTHAGAAVVQVVSPTLQSIEINPPVAQTAAGVVQPFTAIGVYSDDSRIDITDRALWSSSNASVASIEPGEPQGLVRGEAPGAAVVSAVLNGVTGNASLVVTPASVVSVAVGPAEARIRVDDEQAFTAIARLSDGSSREITDEVTWTSASPEVASVSNAPGSEGLALGLAAGSARIQAWHRGALMGAATLQVMPAQITAIVVTPANESVSAGSPVYYSATAVLADATQLDVTKLVTWRSSDMGVASISNAADKGMATTLGPGSTTISATLGTQSGQASLNVTGACNGKEDSVLIVSDVTVRVGGKAQLRVTGVFPDGCRQDLTGDSATVWTSSNQDVFTVGNKSGVVTGIGVGTASVEVKHRSNTDTATVTVVP